MEQADVRVIVESDFPDGLVAILARTPHERETQTRAVFLTLPAVQKVAFDKLSRGRISVSRR